MRDERISIVSNISYTAEKSILPISFFTFAVPIVFARMKYISPFWILEYYKVIRSAKFPLFLCRNFIFAVSEWVLLFFDYTKHLKTIRMLLTTLSGKNLQKSLDRVNFVEIKLSDHIVPCVG